jgi:hypothetical protein
VTAPILIAAGLVALAIAAAALRSFGAGYRLGRLLSGTPSVTIAEARAIAARGEARYVRVSGRLDSTDEFEDEHHRPLVFRRVRVEARRDGRWATIEERRQAVEFEVRESLDAIAVDHQALDVGLIVIPRVSEGIAADAAAIVAPGLPPDTAVRVRIDLVSSVEHATVLGVPTQSSDGTVRMTAGRGRPLILSTLEQGDAMRVLAGGSRWRALVAAIGLAAGLVLLTLGLASAILIIVPTARAASPVASAELGGGDTRSPGEGPGFVGAPLLAILGVLGLGVGTALLTLLYVRLTGGPSSARESTGSPPRDGPDSNGG